MLVGGAAGGARGVSSSSRRVTALAISGTSSAYKNTITSFNALDSPKAAALLEGLPE